MDQALTKPTNADAFTEKGTSAVVSSQAAGLPSALGALPVPAQRVIHLPWKWVLLVLVWVLPSIGAAFYLYGVASNQYLSEFRFNLRSAATPPVAIPGVTGGGGAMSGLSPTIVWDSHVIAQYIKSQDVVAEIDRRFGFKKIYRPDGADIMFRMGRSTSLEDMTEYWRGVVDPFFDMQTGIISVKIRAFSAGDAYQVAQLVLELAEKTVNEMSTRSRQDTLAFARAEVTVAEDKLREAQLAVRSFRNARELINPIKEAEQSVIMLGRQREELGKLKSDLDSLRNYLNADAPPVRVLRSKIVALENSINEEQQKIASRTSNAPASIAGVPQAPAPPGGNSSTLSFALTDFETLMFEQTFRERAYALAQETLQKARIEADKQHLYLNAFVKPRQAQESLFPQRGKTLTMISFGLLVMWGLMCLVIFSIRDHI